jgi:hypothetical protein
LQVLVWEEFDITRPDSLHPRQDKRLSLFFSAGCAAAEQ